MAKSVYRRKNKNAKSVKKSRSHSKKQGGGAASSCLSQYTGAGGLSPSVCGSANIHNTNPQAMGDLDMNNKFNVYGGAVPLGQNLVGGGSCGDEGSYPGSEKGNTFKQYLNNLSQSLDVNLTSGGGGKQKPKDLTGGGYTVDPGQFIAGQPVIGQYDDGCAPALIGGKMIGAGPDQRVCGLGAVQMGGRRKRRGHKKSSKRSIKRSTSTKRTTKHGSRHGSRRSSRRTQRGGDFIGVTRSHPSPYDDAFTGTASYFDDGYDLSTRDFGATQPNYGVMAV